MSQFEIIDPPNLPQKPIRPSRVVIAGAVTLLGLAFALGLIGLLVIMDQRVYSMEDVRRATGLPVLALVPRD